MYRSLPMYNKRADWSSRIASRFTRNVPTLNIGSASVNLIEVFRDFVQTFQTNTRILFCLFHNCFLSNPLNSIVILDNERIVKQPIKKQKRKNYYVISTKCEVSPRISSSVLLFLPVLSLNIVFNNLFLLAGKVHYCTPGVDSSVSGMSHCDVIPHMLPDL
jgi:hypothetical protein